MLRRQLLLGQLGLLPLPLLCPVCPVDCGGSWRSPVPVGAVVARPAVGSTDRGGVKGRALSSPVRSSSRRVASYPFSSSEEERPGSPPPTAGRVPGGTPSVSRPAPAGDRSPRSCPSSVELRSSGPAEWSRLGLSGSLSPPPVGGADVDYSSAVDFLDFDWFSSSLSWPSRETSVSWESGHFPICSMQSSLASILGLMSGFLRHYSCLFLSFATVVFFPH